MLLSWGVSITADVCLVSQSTCDQAMQTPTSQYLTRLWCSYGNMIVTLRSLCCCPSLPRALGIRAIHLGGLFQLWISQILDFDSFIKRLKIYFLFYFYTLPLRLEYWAILRKRQFRECKMIFNYCFATVLIDSRQDNIEVYMSKL